MKYCVLMLLAAFVLSCGDVNKPAKTENDTASANVDTNYNPEAVLDSLGIVLRDQGIPVANYVHAVRTDNLMFLAGKGPKQANGENIIGKLGDSLTIEQGYQAAREVGINQLSVLKAELGDLNKVKRIVSVHGMVNALPDFKDHSKVINGYSDLMVAVFGDKGKHARAAVGMGSLPGNMAVEVEMVVEVYE
ncbi:RidA family protein [Maribacter sp. BPC-D8]|uniref:RidA family protein n=1 Tax=Maribacter sp. BPC-D8 TaxID=3053613 RepID=UPI002B472FA2|nr:RidA family protein [Maribacter sp. BPC-D8]WRI28451.1 RidA family protein [Maribacter sp. BPC-D8]